MRNCPKCGSAYKDDTISHCVIDGTQLGLTNNQQAEVFNPAIESSSLHAHTIISAKYIFLDVVGFTRDRSVEAQSEIVYALNRIVKDSVGKHQIPIENLMYFPTGDGICIALLNIERPIDIHLQIALDIIEGVQKHSDDTFNLSSRVSKCELVLTQVLTI